MHDDARLLRIVSLNRDRFGVRAGRLARFNLNLD